MFNFLFGYKKSRKRYSRLLVSKIDFTISNSYYLYKYFKPLPLLEYDSLKYSSSQNKLFFFNVSNLNGFLIESFMNVPSLLLPNGIYKHKFFNLLIYFLFSNNYFRFFLISIICVYILFNALSLMTYLFE